MTQHYLTGELSLRLAELQAVAGKQACARDVAGLRREAEKGPLTGLGSVAIRALELTDRMCWDSLTRGDAPAFGREAAICAELWEFAVCASLFDDH
jgi:hypothetical protein